MGRLVAFGIIAFIASISAAPTTHYFSSAPSLSADPAPCPCLQHGHGLPSGPSDLPHTGPGILLSHHSVQSGSPGVVLSSNGLPGTLGLSSSAQGLRSGAPDILFSSHSISGAHSLPTTSSGVLLSSHSLPSSGTGVNLEEHLASTPTCPYDPFEVVSPYGEGQIRVVVPRNSIPETLRQVGFQEVPVPGGTFYFAPSPDVVIQPPSIIITPPQQPPITPPPMIIHPPAIPDITPEPIVVRPPPVSSITSVRTLSQPPPIVKPEPEICVTKQEISPCLLKQRQFVTRPETEICVTKQEISPCLLKQRQFVTRPETEICVTKQEISPCFSRQRQFHGPQICVSGLHGIECQDLSGGPLGFQSGEPSLTSFIPNISGEVSFRGDGTIGVSRSSQSFDFPCPCSN